MSKRFIWFQNDNVEELKLDREKLIEKKNDIEEEIKAINEKIAEIESKNKN